MSTNHTIRLYREGEKRWHCGVRNCLNESTHLCSYDRDSDCTVNLDRCREHAQKFLQRHDATYISFISPTTGVLA